MSLTKIISAASSIVEDPFLWTARLPKKHAERAPRLVEKSGALLWVVGDRSQASPLHLDEVFKSASATLPSQPIEALRWLSTSEGRAWLQGRDQVQGEVLYSVGGVWDLINADEDPDFVLACYRAYNDWVAELASQDPEAYIALARVPTTGLADATAELKRAVEQLKLKGAILDSWPDGFDGPPGGPDADPLWEAAAGLGAPLSIHQALNGRREPTDLIHHGSSPAQSLDFNALVYANVFDRYPELRLVCASPSVAWAPSAYESMGESYMRTAGVRKIQLAEGLLPGDYLRTHIWYAVQDDQFAISNRDYFGAAHLMWASFSLSGDDSVWPNTRALFEKRLSAVPAGGREVIGSEVVGRLYGLKGSAPFKREELTSYAKLTLL